MQVQGECAPGFEGVREAFEAERDQLGQGGGAVAVYVHGEPVVDLWVGAASPGTPWQQTSAACLMSATKGLTGACALLLHDRGLLDVDAPVARYWPEFAAEGKDGITVRQVLSNTCGLPIIPGYLDLLGRAPEFRVSGLNEHAEIHRRLAAAKPVLEPGRPAYGIMTFGYLVGALVTRVAGVSLAEFLHRELVKPLDLQIRMGPMVAEAMPRLADQLAPAPLPPDAPAELVAHLDGMMAAINDPDTLLGQGFLAGTGIDFFTERFAERHRKLETFTAGHGAGDAVGTARGLARLYAMLAGGGVIDGKRFVSAESVAAFSEVQTREVDAVTQTAFPWTMGFHGNMPAPDVGPGTGGLKYGPSGTAFGKDGLGGQVGFADPEHGVGFGFVRSQHAIIPELRLTPTLGPGISLRLVAAVYQALGA